MQKGYCCFDIITRKHFGSVDVTFLKTILFRLSQPRDKMVPLPMPSEPPRTTPIPSLLPPDKPLKVWVPQQTTTTRQMNTNSNTSIPWWHRASIHCSSSPYAHWTCYPRWWIIWGNNFWLIYSNCLSQKDSFLYFSSFVSHCFLWSYISYCPIVFFTYGFSPYS